MLENDCFGYFVFVKYLWISESEIWRASYFSEFCMVVELVKIKRVSKMCNMKMCYKLNVHVPQFNFEFLLKCD